MSERMDNAMRAADRCWRKAVRVHPEFVNRYLEHCEGYLLSRKVVGGDEFKSHCNNCGLRLPKGLHHNTWVGGPTFMETLGWIEPIQSVTPTKSHNHMKTVTQWRSRIYGATDYDGVKVPEQKQLFS